MVMKDIIQAVIKLYDDMEYGDSASISLLVRNAGYVIDHDALFDVYGELIDYASSKGELLDYSEYEDKVVGLAYNLWFVKTKADN